MKKLQLVFIASIVLVSLPGEKSQCSEGKKLASRVEIAPETLKEFEESVESINENEEYKNAQTYDVDTNDEIRKNAAKVKESIRVLNVQLKQVAAGLGDWSKFYGVLFREEEAIKAAVLLIKEKLSIKATEDLPPIKKRGGAKLEPVKRPIINPTAPKSTTTPVSPRAASTSETAPPSRSRSRVAPLPAFDVSDRCKVMAETCAKQKVGTAFCDVSKVPPLFNTMLCIERKAKV